MIEYPTKVQHPGEFVVVHGEVHVRPVLPQGPEHDKRSNGHSQPDKGEVVHDGEDGADGFWIEVKDFSSGICCKVAGTVGDHGNEA